VELHQLRYFVTVVSTGTFTRAAERLYITQPSLSEQIRKLEAELGTSLFERLGRSLRLTSAGEVFLPHAERVLLEVEEARRRVREVLGVHRGHLGLGSLPGPAVRLLPRLLAEFHRRHPGIDVTLREEDSSPRLEDAIHRGELDLAIVRVPGRRSDLESRPLVREPMVAVTSAEHALARRHDVRLAELAHEPFVALRRGHELRDLLEEVCRGAGFQPRIVLETGRAGTATALAASGFGVTVLPRMVVGRDGHRVAVQDPHAIRELGVVWARGRSLAPAAVAFLGILSRRSLKGTARSSSGPRRQPSRSRASWGTKGS
jgi:DNA-binding transcriptional LysR family regulator